MEVTQDPEVRAAHARDSSGLEMVPDAVARPRDFADVIEIVRRATDEAFSVTPAGSQTSTTAASITDRGVLLSMRAMDRILDIDPDARTARVQPGVLLGDLNREAAKAGLLFAPDPTSEEEATVGGAIACNASGARTLRYGPVRGHVRAVTAVTSGGVKTEFRRSYLEKNTVGFAGAQDPVDWFVGSEGTLGVIVEAELALVPKPASIIGLAVPFRSEHDALAFVVRAREHGGPVARAQCLEFFDAASLDIARPASSDPGWAREAGAMVYLEQATQDGDPAAIQAALDEWLAVAEASAALTDSIRVFDGEAPLREARRIRHAVPSTMNERGGLRRAHGGRKVSTDWAVPYRKVAEALDFSRRVADAHRVSPAITFGHVGNGHPHQNFIAADADELARIQAVLEETIAHVLSVGGTVAAEHGLGKLKRHWLPVQCSPLQVSAMRALKNTLDPRGIFAPGNIL